MNEEIEISIKSSEKEVDVELSKKRVEFRIQELERREKMIDEREKLIDSKSSEMEERLGKKIEYYSQTYAAFLNTRLEKDKGLLTLSVAGLGFIVSKLPSSGKSTTVQYSIFTVCAFCFLVCVLLILHIFSQNAEYLQAINTKKPKWEIEYLRNYLSQLDKWSTRWFIFGVITTVIYAYFA